MDDTARSFMDGWTCAAGLKAQCGSVTVPLDRANPSAGTTEVQFALVPHRDSSVPSEGTILYNPGGPGEAAIAEAADVAEQFAPVLDRRDLLLVDPRWHRPFGRNRLSCTGEHRATVVHAP